MVLRYTARAASSRARIANWRVAKPGWPNTRRVAQRGGSPSQCVFPGYGASHSRRTAHRMTPQPARCPRTNKGGPSPARARTARRTAKFLACCVRRAAVDGQAAHGRPGQQRPIRPLAREFVPTQYPPLRRPRRRTIARPARLPEANGPPRIAPPCPADASRPGAWAAA